MKFYLTQSKYRDDCPVPNDPRVTCLRAADEDECVSAEWAIEISTLEELLELTSRLKDPLIIDTTTKYNDDNESKFQYRIEVYNGYRE